MPSRDESLALARRLHALAGGDVVRRKAAARLLARHDPIEATELIHHLLALAREGSEIGTCVLSSFTAALALEAANIPHAPALRRLAQLQDLDEVAALFESGPAVRELDPDSAARRDARTLPDATLGMMKTKARVTRNPDELSRLALASDPSIVQNVLLNPRLTEPLVVRVAARRPARPEPLIEIFRSSRWGNRHLVRRALVFNPYFPPEYAAKLVPLLNTTDLKELANDLGVHPSLREQARLLLASAANARAQGMARREAASDQAPPGDEEGGRIRTLPLPPPGKA